MFKVFICSFGSVFDSNEQIITYTNTRLVDVLVCAIVRYYLKKNPSVNRQKGCGGLKALKCKWGFMLYTCAHSLDHVNTHEMTTNLKWSFFLMTLSGTLIPIFKKISYAPTGSLGHSSETKVNMEFVFTFNEIG